MANSVIQIKRSNTEAQASNLAFGELAYSLVSNNLFIGTDSNTVIKIGGGSDVALLNVTPGTLTNGAALVVNSTGGIDTLTIGNFTAVTQSTDGLTASGNVVGNNVISNNNLEAANLDISGSANVGGTLSVTDVEVAANLTVDGDIVLRGDSITLGDGGDVISLGASVNTHILPDANVSRDLGSSIVMWRNIYGANVYVTETAPTANGQLANKKYVDDQIGAIEQQGSAINLGDPTDGAYANGSGAGNVEGALTSLANTTTTADAVDALNEAVRIASGMGDGNVTINIADLDPPKRTKRPASPKNLDDLLQDQDSTMQDQDQAQGSSMPLTWKPPRSSSSSVENQQE